MIFPIRFNIAATGCKATVFLQMQLSSNKINEIKT